jgi:NDP-sugar pyrophosphorylase family protein
VRKRDTSRYLLFEEGQLCGWKNEKSGEVKMSYQPEKEVIKYAFSGIQMLDPRIFSLISEEGVFSTIPMYLRLAATEKIVAYPHDDGQWIDVGRVEHLEKAHAMLRKINLF